MTPLFWSEPRPLRSFASALALACGGGLVPCSLRYATPCLHVAGPGPGGPMLPGPHPSRLPLAYSGLCAVCALLAALAFSATRGGKAVAALRPPAYAPGS